MHFYIHIPFCESKCHYCAFTSLNLQDEKSYMNALLADIKDKLVKFNIKKISTLFIGGGTPSCVEAALYEPIFKVLSPYFSKNCEITTETNPNSASLTWLKTMKDYGINRLSFGAQSFNDEKLAFLGRAHTHKEIYKVLENAQKIGFKNINLDLIYDTKMDDKKNLEFELKALQSVQKTLTHISAYSLSIEPHTTFSKKEHFKKNATNLAHFFIKGIENLGFFQYEISNFAKKGFKCRHNLAYWQRRDYAGAGLSSVGFLKNERFYTYSSLKTYIKEPCFRKNEILSKKELYLEHLFLGLRSCVGVKKGALDDEAFKKANLLLKHKKLELKRDKFFAKNYLLADELALFLSE